MKARSEIRNTLFTYMFLAFVLLQGPLAGLAQVNNQAIAAPNADPDLAQKLTLAEGHHDLAILYLKKGELDLALAEARDIIQIRFPADYERLVAQSLSIISEKLAEMNRFDLGQMLMDEALKVTEQDANRVRILKNKARLYMLAGDNDRAIESWRRALDLESKRVP
jgi:tetratricopeptide (TPR) repeat protein